MRVMKKVGKELKRKGVTMKSYYDNFPLCCPARSTLLTGQYAHNHHVLSNSPPDGGYGVFNELHGDNYLPLWLQAAGYRTSYVGKYENGYAEPDEYGTVPSDVPRGWDDWHVLAPSRAQYFNYTLNQNGSLRQYTDAEEDYSHRRVHEEGEELDPRQREGARRRSTSSSATRRRTAAAAATRAARATAPRSPHRAISRTLKGKFKNTLPPSFNEADVSDKPSAVAEKAPLTEGQISDTLRKRRCAWESLLAVDDSVDALVDEIQRDGIKNNTYIFFLSDNGFLRGEHRIRDNKRYIYEESARVPFIARGPGIPHGESSEDVVVNADLTSTILELAGASAGLTQDGQSLMPSLLDPKLERGRAILLEAYAGEQILGVRTSRYLYTEWDGDKNPLTPEKELYDTYADPVRAQQPRQRPRLPVGRAPARPRARPADRLRRRRLSRRAQRHPDAGDRRQRPGRLHVPAGDREVLQPGREPDSQRLVPRRQRRARRRHRGAVRGSGPRFCDPRRAARCGHCERQGVVHRRPAARLLSECEAVQVGRAWFAVALIVGLAAATAVAGCGGPDPNPPVTPDPATGEQPNIVFVLTDDQDYTSFNRRIMPHTFDLIVDQGTRFTNYYDATPLCCPARAALLTGQYGHNNGVLNNKPGYGALDRARQRAPGLAAASRLSRPPTSASS